MRTGTPAEVRASAEDASLHLRATGWRRPEGGQPSSTTDVSDALMCHRTYMHRKERDARSRLGKIVRDLPLLKGAVVEMKRTCGKEAHGC